MKDSFGRTIDYLRISITDRCNFRCVYCMPEEGVQFFPPASTLTCDEIVRIARLAVGLGVSKIRVTGGEPTVRPDLVDCIGRLAAIPGVRDLSMTSNGQLLPRLAGPLAEAGLNRVNVSLDTLQEQKFNSIARGKGDLASVLAGIRAAREAGLTPCKVNVVAMRGVNDDEFADFAAWTTRESVHVRFIELMPISWNLDESPAFETARAHPGVGLLQVSGNARGLLDDLDMRRRTIPMPEIRSAIELKLGPLSPSEVPTNGPARTFRLESGIGTVGFISQISNDLCARCNRIRLTADGFLRPCLMSDGETNLRDPMRSGATDDELRELVALVVQRKPERHFLAEGQRTLSRTMSQIGG